MSSIITQAIKNGFPVFIIGIIIYFLVKKILFRKYKATTKVEIIRLLLVFYILFIISITAIPHWRYALQDDGSRKIVLYTDKEKSHVNIIPFKTISLYISGDDESVDDYNKSAIINLIGNICFYFPIGFLGVLALNKRKNAGWIVFLTGFLLCVIIEIIQSFIGRSCDIDDVLLNMVGLLIGIVAVRIINAVKLRKAAQNANR